MYPFIVYFKDNLHPLLETTNLFIKNNAIHFENPTIASIILTPIFFKKIKQASFNKIKKEGLDTVLNEKHFLLYLIHKEIDFILHAIDLKIKTYFLKENTMNFDGFLNFFLKEEKELFTYHFIFAFEEYFDQGSVKELKDLRCLLEKRMHPLDIVLSIDEKKQIQLWTNEKKIKKESVENTESIISDLVYYAPNQLIVKDPHHLLPREYAMLIKQLFKQKVDFDERKNNTYSM